MNYAVRVAAVQVLQAVFGGGQSVSDILRKTRATLKPQDAPWLQALCYGVLRDYGALQALLRKLLAKPFKSKDQDVELLLLVGLYQLRSMQLPAHAAVNETVAAVKSLKKLWAVGVVNGVLRNFIRQSAVLEAQLTDLEKYSHPQWLVSALQADWPKHWQQILTANQQHPPMTLRVNVRKTSKVDYAKLLKSNGVDLLDDVTLAQAAIHQEAPIMLAQPVDIKNLPHFADGWVSIQDASAQLAAEFLDCKPGMRVLDACAAPGGKTAHVLEKYEALDVLAIDQDAERLKKVHENLQRLQLKAELKCADVGLLNTWWDGQLFDRILLDAPCSASGVIRRHPDIKWLRRPTDIPVLAEQQLRFLSALWPMLKPGGKLLYATCSVLKQENHQVIAAFLQRQPDAERLQLPVPEGFSAISTEHGLQCLPSLGDGFFYALLAKR